MLDGVEAAHLLGVNHRDLKPENVLYDERSKTLVVADFGAAEFTEEELYTVVETKPGERIANFQYAAPEQKVRGGAVDHRADIFALGLILNEMYTGQVPSGTNPRVISAASPDHAFLDPLVELMMRQIPADRPGTVGDVKRQIAASASEFVSFQRLNALKTAVVPATSADVPPPVQVVDLDYNSQGRDHPSQGPHLQFVLEPKRSREWILIFNSLSRRRNITSLQNRGPETVRFSNGMATIDARQHEVESAVRYFKDWVNYTNQALPGELEAAARKRDEDERERIRRAAEAEETRLNVLRLARKALG